MAVGVFSLASCRQSDEMDSSVTSLTKKSINTQPDLNTTSTSDSIVVIQALPVDSDERRDGTPW